MQADELSFEEGDTLYIMDMNNKDWWKAKCGRNTGLIPSNYGMIFWFDSLPLVSKLIEHKCSPVLLLGAFHQVCRVV